MSLREPLSIAEAHRFEVLEATALDGIAFADATIAYAERTLPVIAEFIRRDASKGEDVAPWKETEAMLRLLIAAWTKRRESWTQCLHTAREAFRMQFPDTEEQQL